MLYNDKEVLDSIKNLSNEANGNREVYYAGKHQYAGITHAYQDIPECIKQYMYKECLTIPMQVPIIKIMMMR